MSDLINSIVNRDFVSADSIIQETVELIMARKLEEAKKMCAAKITEQGLDTSAAELTKRGVVEEDSIDEVNLSGEPSAIGDIEDRRASQKPVQSGKSSLPANQSQIVASGKSDMPKPQTVAPGKSDLKEEEQLEEARIKIIKARIRGGKIQRRKKISNVPGMTIRGGKLKRMSPAERRRRKMGQKRGKIKRQAKMNRAIMKRQRSLRKRKALGL